MSTILFGLGMAAFLGVVVPLAYEVRILVSGGRRAGIQRYLHPVVFGDDLNDADRRAIDAASL